MGMYVLYGAFGLVALWLLAEVLLQYKARLRWRLLAFAGFLGVVAGVVLPSVMVIGVGAAAFAVGQTLVTLSFRKGFVAGWALRRGAPEDEDGHAPAGRRAGARPRREEPSLHVSGFAFEDADGEEDVFDDRPRGARRPAGPDVFQPEPVPEETGSYGIQSLQDPQGGAPYQGYPSADPSVTAPFASPFTTADQDAHQYAAHYDPQAQPGYDYSGGYHSGGEQQVYAAYSDPYIGTGGVAQPQPYGYADPYVQQQYGADTPPGGVWVPQQRDAGQPYPPPQQQPWAGQDPLQQPQPYPYQGTGEYEQYRY
ncbi:hypothetical protein [Streptomyces sp. NPDC012888]|uniref:hypothetical protein n=1 Tax=Streptomyces sp. NPDC012888 TaxID=3364855 RepID=UPI0036CB5222